MTTAQLSDKLYGDGALDSKLPEEYEVDVDTYANVCQDIFNDCRLNLDNSEMFDWISISIGPKNGIMFKNVELILKR